MVHALYLVGTSMPFIHIDEIGQNAIAAKAQGGSWTASHGAVGESNVYFDMAVDDFNVYAVGFCP
jgi:hypothetical protein